MKSRRFFVILLALVLMFQGAVMGVSVLAQTEASSAEKQYKIWFDEAAPWTVEGFERWSLPLGNGYMGINVFGGVETELLSVTENSVFNPGGSSKGTLDSATGIYYNDFGDERIDAASGGLNLMAKTYIDFAGHTTEAASNYKRELSLDDSVAKVSYEHDGVTYTREYFSTYPDKVTVMRLSASKAGKLSFTLRPEIPFCYDPDVDATKYSYLDKAGDGMTKTGNVTAQGDTITLKGTMDYYGTDFEGLYKVIPTGGSMVAANDANGKNGTITVTDADSVLIILAVGTNYEYEYSTFDKAKGMLDDAPDPHEKVQGWLDAASAKSFDQLLANHQADYKEFFNRASLDLGGVFDSALTTDGLVDGYGTGNTANDRYLEEMAFQFGRYLLIASSREGCLPANLQGIWNFADSAAWSGGYWHNINVQMNYWPAFNTGLAELFQSYVDYNEAMRTKAEVSADTYLKNIKSPSIATAGTGENGYTIGTGCSPYYCASASTNGHSGPGTVAFTSLLFWDWYEFTQDKAALAEHVYPAVEGAAKFLSKTVKQYDDGKYLVYHSASPENFTAIDPETGKQLYVHGVGCAFDQQMVYANHLATQQAAKELGYSEEDYSILKTINEQIDKLDPVNVGYSGQVKEYREENFYGEFGEKSHRHISQLVGVYPAAVINGETDAWLDAAAVSLENRGYTNIAWGVIHRMLCWARIQDGEQAFEELETMLTEHLGYSLLSNYNSLAMLSSRKHNNPFQIEANFGYTAAVAEMLVQSQAGYIEFLPALPKAWADGSFQGLTTRGNFAVDADWENGVATSFAIESRSGKECAVKYPNIANAVVKDSQGNTVSFTAEGEDLIRFATTAGETYTITGIPSHTPNLAAPTGLTLDANGTTMDLSWTASEGASTYNVYRAINDEPSYTLVKEGVTGTNYTYEHNIQGYDRVTMRVVAVAADGTESPSALAYSLPVTALEQVKGYLFEGNALQLEFEAAENATEYRAYENGTLVATSKYPLVVVKNADATATYTVSAVVDGRESAATEATVYHAAKQDNIMLNKPMTLEGRDYWLTKADPTLYPGSKAVNGTITTSGTTYDRWAVSDKSDPYSVTADLGGFYKLGTLKIYEWMSNSANTRSDNTTVEVLNEQGQWQTVQTGFALVHGGEKTVEMGGVIASKIRFTFQDTEGKSASITEITCTGEKIDATNKIELLEAVQAYAGQNVTSSNFAGVPVAYILAEPEAIAVLADENADQRTVDKAARALTKAKTGTNIFLNRPVTSGLTIINNYPLTYMVDGNMSTRLAVSANTKPDPLNIVVTVELDGLYHLEGVFVQEFLNNAQKTEGGDVTIEVSVDGSSWTTVLSGASLREYRDGIPTSNCSNTAFLFDNTHLASKVRISFYDTYQQNTTKTITIYEAQAYGEKVDESILYLSSNLLTLNSGKTHSLTSSVAGVTWASSDPDVVSVDGSGKLTAINLGYATITATDASGNKASCEVTVLCDTSALEKAITDAKTAITGVRGIDRTADRVVSGVKFVPTERLTALEQAIAKAESALPTATTAALVNSAASALNTELDKFNAALKTGSMDIASHKHCVCTGAQDHTCSTVTWTAWGDDAAERTSLPVATGYYFLVDDITISKNYDLGTDNPSVLVSLCLNGFDVEATHTGDHVYNVYSVLNVCDCSAEENWGSIIGNASGSVGAAIQLRDNRSNKGTLNFYSGIITAKESSVSTQGGLVMIGNTGENGAVLNMYGGKLCGGRAQQGGAVAIRGCGAFNMYGGNVCDNFADSGAVAEIVKFKDAEGKINIYGGTIGASKNLSGAAVSDFAISGVGTVQISGGTFIDGLSVEDTTLKGSLAENTVIVKSADGSVVALEDSTTGTGSATVVACSGAFAAESASLQLSADTVEYDGRNDTPVPNALVKFGPTTLVKDTHYTISYRRNGAATTDLHSPGQITVVVTGVAPYSGTLTATYTVLDCSRVDKSALEAAITAYGNLNSGAANFAGTPTAYQLALHNANAVLSDSEATQEQVDAAAEALIKAATKNNIFLKQGASVDKKSINNMGADLLVDGDSSSRQAMSHGSNAGNRASMAATITLDAVYSIDAIFMDEFIQQSANVSRAKTVKLEFFRNGAWVELNSDAVQASTLKGTGNHFVTGFYFDSPIEASAVRMTFTHRGDTSNDMMTIYELQAYGTKINREVLEEALEQYGNLNTGAASFAGTPLAYEKAKQVANTVLADEAATQAQIDGAAANLIKAATKRNIFFNKPVEADRVCVDSYTAAKIVDQVVSEPSRFAMSYINNKDKDLKTASFTVALDAVYKLEGLFFQEFLNANETISRAKSVMVEAFVDGQWTTVIAEGEPAGKPDTTSQISEVTALILEQPVLASQVRVTYTHAAENITGSGQLVTIYELQAYGEKLRPLTDENLKFKGAAVCLQDDLSVQFKVNKALLEENGLSDPYAVFEFAGRKITESNFREENGVLVFTLRNITPHQLGETITAELYATKDGVLYVSKPVTYSIKQYCQRILAQYNTDAYAELRTLLVNLLNYGAAAQKYVDPSIANDDLVNSWLTTEQKSWGTEDMPAVSSDACAVKGDLVDPAVTCTGVGLYLENSVAIRFKLTADSIDGLTAEFTAAGKRWQSAEFVPVQGEAGSYHVYFRNLNAGQMRETVCCTFYRGGEAVSNTFCYSVECYVANNADNENVLLAELTKAVIRYGDAASQFVK